MEEILKNKDVPANERIKMFNDKIEREILRCEGILSVLICIAQMGDLYANKFIMTRK